VRGWSLLTLVLALAGSGCIGFDTVPPQAVAARRPPFAANGEGVAVDLAMVERPADDEFLSRQLWKMADEQVVVLERRADLDDNGFRIGQLVGAMPEEMHRLMQSERTCIEPRRYSVAPGKTITRVLGPTQARCEFAVLHQGAYAPYVFENMEFCLDLCPILGDNDKVQLRFTPKIQYTEPTLPFRPAADRSGWVLDLNKPSKTFPELTWDVPLRPGEILLVGARPGKHTTFAGKALLIDDGVSRKQRVLVVRCQRLQTRSPGDHAFPREVLALPAPPLALQATMTNP